MAKTAKGDLNLRRILRTSLLMLLALLLTGCSAMLTPHGHHVESDKWNMTDIEGTWTVYSTWFQEDGRARITFHASYFEAWGYTEPSGNTAFTLNGPNAGQTHTVESPILHFTGNYSQVNGNLKLNIVKAWTTPGIIGGEDDGSGKSSVDDLLNAKSLEFVVQGVNKDVVKLLSSADGPGPEGELNMVLERNSAHAADLMGGFTVELNWLPKFNNGLNFASTPVQPGAGDDSPPPAQQVVAPPKENRTQGNVVNPTPPVDNTPPNNAPDQSAQPSNHPDDNNPPSTQGQSGEPPANAPPEPPTSNPPDQGQPQPGNP